MATKRTRRTQRSDAEIVPLREHCRITLQCPRCDEYGLMTIRQKARIRGTVVYHVTCPNCGHRFVQVGRPYNLWRDIKKRYTLSAEQLRSMQGSMIGTLMETGKLVAGEDERAIRTGDIVLIKPDRKRGSLK